MTEKTSTVILAVGIRLNGRDVPAGSTISVDRTHAGNLVHRGLARYQETPAPAPAAEEPASAGDAPADKAGAKANKGKE